MTKPLVAALGIFVVASVALGDPIADLQKILTDVSLSNAAAPERLHRLFDGTWDYSMHEFPEFATSVGFPGQNDRWTDRSAEAIERRKQLARDLLATVQKIDRSKLNENDQISYDLFRRNAEFDVEGQQFPSEWMPATQLRGVQQNVASLIARTTFKTTKDYEDVIARLNAVPVLVDQNIALMEKGLAQKITPPQITIRDVPQQVENIIAKDAAESPLLMPFKEMATAVPEADRTRLKQAAAESYQNKIVPAFKKLHDYIAQKYLPGARTNIGASNLPNGEKWYAYNVREETTTDLSPAQIHQIGLDEVKRIRGEMDKVMQQVGFKGSFPEFSEYLRKDPKFYYTDAESLLAGYRDIGKRIDPELVKLFGRLPRLPWGVKPVPDYAAKSQTAAYYEQGSLKAGRPGYFFANTYDLPGRPKWGMETLTLHEAVPGHHLQIAVAQEMDELPEFRKHAHYVAFIEGWALYAESLGYEIGFYKDPYQNFGHLSDEMWRAVRLVVDTGLHSMNWTRDQAIEYFASNTPSPRHDIEVEIDRYIVWPGQALGYKLGQLKIRELRTYGEKELGEKFDVRAFHDEVLKNGALPLSILESHIRDWVAKRKTA